MHRIDTATAQKDKFGQGKNGFTRGNPQTGTPATQLDYLYCDAIQEEIANAIESAGIKLDKSKHDQLATAIKEFVEKGSVKLNSSTNSTSETEAATPLAVKKVNDLATENHNNLSNVTDKFTSNNNESIVFSPNHSYHIVMRNDGVCGVYNHLTNKFAWLITPDGGVDGYIGCDRVVGLDDYVRLNSVPVGIPQPWPQDRPPVGWFECNGAQFNVNQFPRLAAAYPDGRLPDLRGEFIRGWDNGHGVDPGRGILSWQNDAIRNIWGQLETFITGAQHDGIGTGAFSTSMNSSGAYQTGSWSGGSHQKIIFDASRYVPVANENRPRNIAFMYIVKAE
ncbi:phage tail protein [Gilliamella sp. WF3-4]|jgi:hypothetical protein|uniref:phage tail protein n=1 Tax=Gilliamella sp. WF3-4 TaxID=3120255 RepID=UPI0009C029F6|nr:tail fiber protein [Gilliamella apicola]